jgi:hypothetical protein
VNVVNAYRTLGVEDVKKARPDPVELKNERPPAVELNTALIYSLV